METAALHPNIERSEEPQPAAQVPPAEFTQEIRFAVVMYGGVSLCIYINGVAQELLELSRVTAVDGDGALLHAAAGAGAVYRRIAQYLESDGANAALLLPGHETKAPIRTRFVVDVLSGTSAGGLNSLFLAKALANDQDMEGLKRLWMDEGEINSLLNDSESVKREDGLVYPAKPRSLLNSQRMYLKLLTALDAMDFAEPASGKTQGTAAASAVQPVGRQPSPHVAELDCYITTTDLSGWPVQLKLDNTVATEQRHRNVFHFRYREAEGCNDFVSRHNPFLAFAGRCTSAFPFAFEPMKLDDIDGVLRHSARHNLEEPARTALRSEWAKRFYPDYAESRETFGQRSFGDGGYLDNKPFSYATRTLMRRRAELPVQRKLLYIDPSPEAVAVAQEGDWDFLRNCKAALLDLPRYETIREDIQAVIDRNKLLDTVRRLTSRIDGDVSARREKRRQDAEAGVAKLKPYEERGLQERIMLDGIGYGTYHRLRVIAVTVNLAHLLSRAADFDPASDECQAIRWIVQHWREAMFDEEPAKSSRPFGSDGDQFAPGRSRSSQNSFLSAFDIDYRLRRIFFLQRRVAFLTGLCPGVQPPANDPVKVSLPCPPELWPIINDPEKLKAFRAELRRIKRGLAEPLRILLCIERALLHDDGLAAKLVAALHSPGEKRAPTAEAQLQQATTSLRALLNEPGLVTSFYQDRAEAIDGIAREIAAKFEQEFDASRKLLANLLLPGTADPLLAGVNFNDLLPVSPEEFDDYDTVIFPIQFGTDAAEANRVDIVRISPPDASGLIKERTEGEKRRKLAGTAIFSFGAFLARFWRENDMLWGRLDAAEVLIRTLLQGSGVEKDVARVQQLIDEAHRSILSQTLTRTQREELWSFICEAFAATAKARAQQPVVPQDVRSAVADLLREFPEDLDKRLRAVLRFAGEEEDEKLRTYFKEKYEVRRSLAMTEQLRLVARSGRIVSRMLDVLAREKNSPVEKHTAFLVRAATVIWGLVEIAIPRTLCWHVWEDWRYRCYTVGAVLCATGLLWQPALLAGLVAIAVTLLIDIARRRVSDLMRGVGRWRSLLTWLLIAAGLIIIALAAWKGVELWRMGRAALFKQAG